MSICQICRGGYNWWTSPVGAKEVCPECFEAQLRGKIALPPEDAVLEPMAQKTAPEQHMLPIRLSLFLPRSRSKVVFALVMACYCIALSAFISAWAYAVHVKGPPRGFYLRGDAADVFGSLLFAPVVESLILIAVFELVRRAHAPAAIQIGMAAFFISVGHAWPWWPHAVIVLPSFCIQAASYHYWRRVSWKDGFWVLVSIHALNNVIPTLSAVSRAMRHA